jgi:hypothetical protein
MARQLSAKKRDEVALRAYRETNGPTEIVGAFSASRFATPILWPPARLAGIEAAAAVICGPTWDDAPAESRNEYRNLAARVIAAYEKNSGMEGHKLIKCPSKGTATANEVVEAVKAVLEDWIEEEW